jgi:ATP-dependent Clp protease ATP-binding subunit ClpA
LKKALELAVRETGESPLRSEHVLLGLASVEDCVAAQILTAHGINEAEVRAALNRVLPG